MHANMTGGHTENGVHVYRPAQRACAHAVEHPHTAVAHQLAVPALPASARELVHGNDRAGYHTRTVGRCAPVKLLNHELPRRVGRAYCCTVVGERGVGRVFQLGVVHVRELKLEAAVRRGVLET